MRPLTFHNFKLNIAHGPLDREDVSLVVGEQIVNSRASFRRVNRNFADRNVVSPNVAVSAPSDRDDREI